MLFRQQAEQIVVQKQKKKISQGKESTKLEWWDLSLIGTGAIIGAGFFLGTALSIRQAGPSIIIAYLVGGVTAFLVFSALADMFANDPQEGSFRVYARKAFGHYMGFISGWMYWVAGVLIMSAEVTALAIFSSYWLPHFPLWAFAAIYSFLGLTIVLLGVKDFGRIESLFGIVKISSLLIFILFGLLFATGLITPVEMSTSQVSLTTGGAWFPNGMTGTWSAMIFVLFSYGGIEIMGILFTELKDTREIGRSGRVMFISLTLVYTLALLLIFLMVPWQSITLSKSPFVTALSSFGFTFVDSLLNAIIISAAFSTMVGALFGVTNVMVSLANDEDAPEILAHCNKRGVPIYALSLSALGLSIAIIFSFLLPNTVYEYLATAAGIMLILNWIIILSSQIRNKAEYIKANKQVEYAMPGFPYTSYLAISLILLTIAGTLLSDNERIGVLVSLGFVGLIYVYSKVRLT